MKAFSKSSERGVPAHTSSGGERRSDVARSEASTTMRAASSCAEKQSDSLRERDDSSPTTQAHLLSDPIAGMVELVDEKAWKAFKPALKSSAASTNVSIRNIMYFAGMVKLVDTQHLNCCEATRAGSIPAPSTNLRWQNL